MKIFFGVLLASLLLPFSVFAQTALNCTFTWNPVTTYTDGTPGTPEGYRLYKRFAQDPPYVKGNFDYDILVSQLSNPQKPNVVNVCQVNQIWVVTAYYTDINGVVRESAYSNTQQVTQILSRPSSFRARTSGTP